MEGKGEGGGEARGRGGGVERKKEVVGKGEFGAVKRGLAKSLKFFHSSVQ